MADDRLDDAIDAVVRAVDRIERATRAAAPVAASAPLGDATRPIQGSTANFGAFWAPRSADPAPNEPGVTGSFDAGAGLGARLGAGPDPGAVQGPGQPPQSTAEFSALGAAAIRPFAEHGASPEVHELVGRIVGRMQSLEDNLAAASQLRSEISELVARLAAAAGRPR